jgi:hypothetical protein
MADSGCVNSILQSGDDFSHTLDKANGRCVINIAFNGSVKNLDVEISRTKSQESA